jgi:hypothetical protein
MEQRPNHPSKQTGKPNRWALLPVYIEMVEEAARIAEGDERVTDEPPIPPKESS